MKKLISVILALTLVFTLGSAALADGEPVYKVGLCTWVDHASSNQILDSIEARLAELGDELGVVFEVDHQNANADVSTLDQILANFIANGVDVMVGEATPVATAMQAVTEDNQIPVVFAAVSDPVGSGIVASMEAPGANLTGTSDYLNTEAVLDLVLAADPDADLIGLLYDVSQDSSTTSIAEAKAYLDEKGISYVERTGTTLPEVQLAAEALVADGVDAVFTPTDNTIQEAELSIYETLANAGIPHYAGADSFARNGAFLGYGVNYVTLGVETANMVAHLLVDGADPAETPVVTFDNGIATVNTETCEAVGFDLETVKAAYADLCSDFVTTITGEEMEG